MENLKVDDINLTCEVHKSPIGGVCSDPTCEEKPLLCIFCAIDENSCIRKKNHQIITFEEYFNRYEKALKDKLTIGISKETLINNINKLDTDEVRSDYVKSLNKKEKAYLGYCDDVKSKLKANFAKELEIRLSFFDKALAEMKIGRDYLEKLKENGFDLLATDLGYRVERVKNGYTEFSQVERFDLLPSGGYGGEFVISGLNDYAFMNKYILLLKTLQNDKLLKEKLTNITRQHDALDIYEQQTDKGLENFDSFLYGWEMGVPNMLTNYMIEESGKSTNMDSLRKYMGVSHNDNNIFSYSIAELFNTGKKQAFCTADPKSLKYNLTITNIFQTKNTLPEMINIFKTFDQNKYLAFSNDKGVLYYTNYNDGFKLDMPLKTIEGNKGIVYKLDHYFSESEMKDYLVTITSEKWLYIFVYNPDTQGFTLCTTFSFTSVCYSFEIIELSGKPYILTSILKEEIKMYNFHDMKLVKSMEKINSHVYSIKSFYHKKLNQYILMIMTSDSIVLLNIETGLRIKSLINSAGKKNWFLHGIAVETENDYLIVANMQNDLGVFSFETGKLVRSFGSKTTAYRGIELWNEKYVIAGNDNKEIDIIDLTTGSLVHNLKHHTKHICGCKRIKDKEEMLISFSMDGTLMLYTCS
jgi:WD40 repeat protein